MAKFLCHIFEILPKFVTNHNFWGYASTVKRLVPKPLHQHVSSEELIIYLLHYKFQCS